MDFRRFRGTDSLPHLPGPRGRGQLRARARAAAAGERRARHRQDAARRGHRRGARPAAHPLAVKSHHPRAGRPLRLRHRAAPLRLALRRRRREGHPPLHQARARWAQAFAAPRARGAADRRGRQGRPRVPQRPAPRARPDALPRHRDRRRDRRARAPGRGHHLATTRRSCPTRSCAAACSTSSSSPISELMRAHRARAPPGPRRRAARAGAARRSTSCATSPGCASGPSTSELIDWIAVLRRAGIASVELEAGTALPRRAAQEASRT